MIIIKDNSAIKGIKKSCNIAASIINELYNIIEHGTNVITIEETAIHLCNLNKVKPAFLGYSGYMFSTCISINDEVVHGLPANRVIDSNDVISVDFGVICDGWYSDVAFTKSISNAYNKYLTKTCRDSLYAGISEVIVNNRVGDISNRIQSVCEENNFHIVKDLVGHGVGKKLHEEPQVPNHGERNSGLMLKTGMVIAIEPIISENICNTYVDVNGWTVKTDNNCSCAHFEHTVVLLSDGVEILTDFNI